MSIAKERDRIQSSIKQGRTEQALDILEELIEQLGDDQLKKEAILIYSSFSYQKINYNKGIIISEELNVINDKILTLLDKIVKLYGRDEVVTELALDEKGPSQRDFSLKDRILSARTVDILSYSCKGILDEYSHHITEMILNGGRVRLIFINKDSPAFRLMMRNTRVESVNNDIDKTLMRIGLIQSSIKRYNEALVDNLMVKQIAWIPSTNLFLFDAEDTRGVISTKVNPIFYSTPMTERLEPQVLYKKDDPRVFEYYRIQYEHLWRFNDCQIPDFKAQIEYMGKKILK